MTKVLSSSLLGTKGIGSRGQYGRRRSSRAHSDLGDGQRQPLKKVRWGSKWNQECIDCACQLRERVCAHSWRRSRVFSLENKFTVLSRMPWCVLFCFHAQAIGAASAYFPYGQARASCKCDATVAFGCRFVTISWPKNDFLDLTK